MPTASAGRSPENWEHLGSGVLRLSRPSAVGVTCLHFRHAVRREGVTLLSCPVHQGLIARGEHLTKRCAQWSPQPQT